METDRRAIARNWILAHLDSRPFERSNQVRIGVDEAQSSGKSHLPIVGVPGFPGLILGPSVSTGVHDRRSRSR